MCIQYALDLGGFVSLKKCIILALILTGCKGYKSITIPSETNDTGKNSIAPSRPILNSFSPLSPANNNSPSVLGTAEVGVTIKIFTNASCSGTSVGTGVVNGSGSSSIAASISDNTTSTFYASALRNGLSSACSDPTSVYVEDSVLPQISL